MFQMINLVPERVLIAWTSTITGQMAKVVSPDLPVTTRSAPLAIRPRAKELHETAEPITEGRRFAIPFS